MTTIIIEDGEQLSRKVFKTFDDLIDEYFVSKGMVLFHQIDFEDLPPESQKTKPR